jgi:hypothetical protein
MILATELLTFAHLWLLPRGSVDHGAENWFAAANGIAIFAFIINLLVALGLRSARPGRHWRAALLIAFLSPVLIMGCAHQTYFWIAGLRNISLPADRMDQRGRR